MYRLISAAHAMPSFCLINEFAPQHFLYEPDLGPGSGPGGEAAARANKRVQAAVRPLYEALDRVLGRPAGLTGEPRLENHFGLRGSRAPPPPGPMDGEGPFATGPGERAAVGEAVARQAEQLLGSLRWPAGVWRVASDA